MIQSKKEQLKNKEFCKPKDKTGKHLKNAANEILENKSPCSSLKNRIHMSEVPTPLDTLLPWHDFRQY